MEYERTSAEVTDVIKEVPADITVTDKENNRFESSVILYVDNPITEWILVDKNDIENKFD